MIRKLIVALSVGALLVVTAASAFAAVGANGVDGESSVERGDVVGPVGNGNVERGNAGVSDSSSTAVESQVGVEEGGVANEMDASDTEAALAEVNGLVEEVTGVGIALIGGAQNGGGAQNSLEGDSLQVIGQRGNGSATLNQGNPTVTGGDTTSTGGAGGSGGSGAENDAEVEQENENETEQDQEADVEE